MRWWICCRDVVGGSYSWRGGGGGSWEGGEAGIGVGGDGRLLGRAICEDGSIIGGMC